VFIGKLPGGKIAVYYESAEEVAGEKSCLACKFYDEMTSCDYYRDCRAENEEWEGPTLFTYIGIDAVRDRMIDMGDLGYDGFKQL
jgi:hypothetical protein